MTVCTRFSSLHRLIWGILLSLIIWPAVSYAQSLSERLRTVPYEVIPGLANPEELASVWEHFEKGEETADQLANRGVFPVGQHAVQLHIGDKAVHTVYLLSRSFWYSDVICLISTLSMPPMRLSQVSFYGPKWEPLGNSYRAPSVSARDFIDHPEQMTEEDRQRLDKLFPSIPQYIRLVENKGKYHLSIELSPEGVLPWEEITFLRQWIPQGKSLLFSFGTRRCKKVSK